MKATGTDLEGDERLVVNPRRARQLLDTGNTRLYELLAAGELDSFHEGRSRKITVDSIHRFIERRLAEEQRRKAKYEPSKIASWAARPLSLVGAPVVALPVSSFEKGIEPSS
jgi:hypothetical protein